MSEVNYQPLSPVSFLERSARVFPDRLAVVDGERRLTYAQFSDHCHATGGALRDLGVQPGERVAVMAFNGTALLAAHYAVPLIGAVLVTINTRLVQPEVAYILGHSEARVLVVTPELLPDLGGLRAECPKLERVIVIGPERVPGSDLTYAELEAAGRGRHAVRHPVPEDDLLAISYTSGTTGLPKGVMYTHRGAYLNALGNAVEVGLTPETCYLWTLPMFHCNGWCYTWSVTAVGGRHVCLPKVVPSEVFRLIAAESVSHLCAAPTVLIDLAGYAAASRFRHGRKLTIMTGGAPPAPQVIRNMEAVGSEVIHLYGLTETYGPAIFCQWRPEWSDLPHAEQALIKARQGVADTMVEQRVVRPDMSDVAPDGAEVGELVIRGNAVMKGYFRDPEATERAFAGGWFHSGDLAVTHPGGYVEVKDRAKDIIISGGEKISTLEVERVIFSHPAVLEAAVVASPHERWGEVPMAFVVLRPGAGLAADELFAYCRERMAGFKAPRRIKFIAELPKTSTGKIQKYVLRQQGVVTDA